MRKFYLIISLLLSSLAFSQTSMSFYHLGDLATFQNSGLNAAHTPDARVFFGLPVMSGVHMHYNNKLSYNQLIRKEGTDNIVDVDGAISHLQANNLLSAQTNVSLFHLGYSVPNGPVFMLFANERIEGDFLYPKSLMEFVFQGNGPLLGDNIELGASGVSVSHFREIGIGMAHQVNRQLRVGGRFKLLQGVFNLSTPSNMVANLKVNPQTYEWQLEAENVVYRTAGMNNYDDVSTILSPGNGGIAVDVGFDFMVNRYLGFSASVSDIGWINWKNDIQSYQYADQTFSYAGVDMTNANDLTVALQDSLFDSFTTTENSDAYKTWLPAKAYGTLLWKYTDNTHFMGSVGARYINGQMKMLYGGGIKQKMGPLTATINAVKMPQHFFNVGAALMVRGGPVQYYVAMDQMVNFSATDFKAADFRTGINFTIGRRAAPGLQGRGSVTTLGKGGSRSGKNKGVSTGSFLGSKVKTKRREGIYSIIQRQKRRDVPASVRPPKIKGTSRRGATKSKTPPKQKVPSPRRRY